MGLSIAYMGHKVFGHIYGVVFVAFYHLLDYPSLRLAYDTQDHGNIRAEHMIPPLSTANCR
jgi:hypothetical protein